MRYVWDPKKATSNRKRHGVTFDEAAEALETDANALIDADLDSDEARARTTALSPRGRVLFIVTTEREIDAIRIISARKATSAEQADYYAQNRS